MKKIFLSLFLNFFYLTITFCSDAPIGSKEDVVHLLNRASLGLRSGDIEHVLALGIPGYIEEQLFPASIPMPASIPQFLTGLETFKLSCGELYNDYGPKNKVTRKNNQLGPQYVLQQATQARLVRALQSPQQLYEVMVDFWYSHFNVLFKKGLDKLWVGVYERDAIRPHVFGKFYDLLLATAKHPAMLYYLDNWENKVPMQTYNRKKKGPQRQGLNENYAREVMELHTMGVEGGYTQEDIIALAKILTGWTFQLKAML